MDNARRSLFFCSGKDNVAKSLVETSSCLDAHPCTLNRPPKNSPPKKSKTPPTKYLNTLSSFVLKEKKLEKRSLKILFLDGPDTYMEEQDICWAFKIIAIPHGMKIRAPHKSLTVNTVPPDTGPE
jgi:hypothetical protein